MHKQLLLKVVGNCRRRSAEGDCPTVEPFSVETLENAVIDLADRVMALERELTATRAEAEAWKAYANHQEMCHVCALDVRDCDSAKELRAAIDAARKP